MDRAGRDLLARAALAGEEHGSVDRRHLAHRGEDVLHPRARAEHALEAARERAMAQLAVLRLEGVEAQRAAQHDLQLVDVDGLDEEVVAAQLDGLECVRPLLAAGDHDDLGGGIESLDLLERGEALLDSAGVRRKPEVERHHGRVLGAHGLERMRALAGEYDVVLVGESPAHLGAQVLVVVDHEQLWLRGHQCGRRRAFYRQRL